MAQKVVVELVDDLDGGAADQTVTFGLDGLQYEIDLSEDNAARLLDTLAEFVAAARQVSSRVKGPARAKPAKQAKQAEVERRIAVREWAIQAGYTIADRGRIPQNIQDAYDRA